MRNFKLLTKFVQTKFTQAYQITYKDLQAILPTHIPQEKKQLPPINQPFPPQPVTIPPTSTTLMNLYQKHQLTSNTSYEQYSLATKSTLFQDFQQQQVKIQQQSWLPSTVLNPPQVPQQYKQTLRKLYKPNISIPNCIQVTDPHSYLKLRPIEQFRHTPLIPIQQRTMQKHREMLQRWHRKGMFLQIRKETVINWILVGIGFLVMYALLKQLGKSTKQHLIQIERKRNRRYDPSL